MPRDDPHTAVSARAVLAVFGLALVTGALALYAKQRERSSLSPEDGDASPAAPNVFAPRTRVGGVDTIAVTFRIRFADPAAALHVLEVAYALPGRARAALRRVGGDRGARILRYRRGDALFGLGIDDTTSAPIEEPERTDELLGLEARLALLVWPESHAWSGEGEERRASLAGLGVLVAELAPVVAVESQASASMEPPARRPHRVRAERLDGTELEVLEVSGWRQGAEDGRTWPTGFEVFAGGVVVREERIESLATDARFVDDWFTPPDRRTRADAVRDRVQPIDLMGGYARDVPLAGEDRTLASAVAEAREVAAKASARGDQLAPHVTLLLDAEGVPQAVRLVLAEDAEPRGDGWRYSAAGPAWVSMADSVGEVDVGRLRELDGASGDAGAACEWTLVVTGEERGGVRVVRRAR